jgi:hypothetical protein
VLTRRLIDAVYAATDDAELARRVAQAMVRHYVETHSR